MGISWYMNNFNGQNGVNNTKNGSQTGAAGASEGAGASGATGSSSNSATAKINELIAKAREWQVGVVQKYDEAYTRACGLNPPTMPFDKDPEFWTNDEDGNKIFNSDAYDAKVAEYKSEMEDYEKQVADCEKIMAECLEEEKKIENLISQLEQGLRSAETITDAQISIISDIIDKGLASCSAEETDTNEYEAEETEDNNQISSKLMKIAENISSVNSEISQAEQNYFELINKASSVRGQLRSIGTPTEPNPEEFVNPEDGSFDAAGFDAKVQEYNKKVAEIQELQQELENIQKEMDSCQSSIEQLKEDKQQLADEFTRLKEVIQSESKSDDIVELTQMLSDTESEARQIEQERLELWEQRSKLEKEYYNLQQEKSDVYYAPFPDQSDPQYYNEVGEFNEEAYNTDIEKWKNRNDTFMAEHGEEMASLKAQIDDLNYKDASLDEQLKTLDKEHSGIQSQMDSTDNNDKLCALADLKTRQTETEYEIMQLTQKMSGLGNQIIEVQSEIHDLEYKDNELDQKLNKLEDERREIQAQIDSFKQYDGNDIDLKELSQKLAMLDQQAEQINQEKEKISEQIETLQLRKKEIENEYERSNTRLQEMNKQNSDLNARINTVRNSLKNTSTQVDNGEVSIYTIESLRAWKTFNG